jgi:hypothetical protein
MDYGLTSMARRNLPTLRALRIGPCTLCIDSSELSLQLDARLNLIMLYLKCSYDKGVAMLLLNKLLCLIN